MLNACEDLNVKFAKFELFIKGMIPKELEPCIIDKERAKKFYESGKKRGIEVFFLTMYPNAIDICESIGVKYYHLRDVDQNNLILYRRLKKIKDFKDKIIFVSCQNPKDTIFWNIAKHQKNIRFLYRVPKNFANIKDYFNIEWKMDLKLLHGIIDYTTDLELFKKANETAWCDFFEMSVCLDKETIKRREFIKTFEELKEVNHEG